MCNLNRAVHIQVGQFQSVDRNDLRLAPHVYLESLGTADEYELGPLKLSRNRYRCSSVSRGRNRGQCAHLVLQALKLETVI